MGGRANPGPESVILARLSGWPRRSVVLVAEGSVPGAILLAVALAVPVSRSLTLPPLSLGGSI